MNGAHLLIAASGLTAEPFLEPRFSSRDYGAREPSESVCWTARSSTPLSAQFALVPVRANEDKSARLGLIRKMASELPGDRQSTIDSN
jgi:hypothetical protein